MKKNSNTNSITLSLKMHNVKIVRLQSGEDIIASYKDEKEEENMVLLDNPMVLIFKRMPTGKAIMMMAPWLPIELVEQNEAWLHTADILTIIEPKASLVDYYQNAITEASEELQEQDEMIESALQNMQNDIDDYDGEDLTEEEEELAMQELEDLRRDVKKRLLH